MKTTPIVDITTHQKPQNSSPFDSNLKMDILWIKIPIHVFLTVIVPRSQKWHYLYFWSEI